MVNDVTAEKQVPFLRCIKPRKLAAIIQKLDDYQQKHYGVCLEKPLYLERTDPGNIKAPLAREEAEMETLKEMARPPEHQERTR